MRKKKRECSRLLLQDKDTNERVIPVQGADFIITASPESFTTGDSKLIMDPPMNPLQKAEWASKKLGGKYYSMLALPP